MLWSQSGDERETKTKTQFNVSLINSKKLETQTFTRDTSPSLKPTFPRRRGADVSIPDVTGTEPRYMDLNYNSLVQFPAAVRSLSHLKELGFHSNSIQSIPEHAFTGNLALITIDLSYNHIQTLPTFSGCENIQKIDLHHNEIEELQENTFHGLTSLSSLDLSWNRLSSVKQNSFSALPALTKLDLSSNQLSSLPLMGLQSLTHLRLAGNDQLTELIPGEELPRVRVMELPYAFQCCAFTSCERRGGGLSWDKDVAAEFRGKENAVLSSQGPFRPCLHLLGGWMVRGGVWLVAALSLVSNSLVVLSVFFSPASSVTPPKLLIGLLALVNGLMGVWSGWLAAVDAWTFGSFWRYGAKWESSFLCRLSGFLYVFASQTGLFLLTAAALERCLAAAAAARHDKTDEHDARSSSSPLSVRLSVVLSFLLGLAVTLPPLVAGHSSTSLCLPLPSSSSSSSSSLVFSVSLVLLDALCFLLVTLAYTHLYCHAHKAPPVSEEEAALTRHVAWLLFSDCLLYLPVAFLCFSSLLRLPAAAGPEAAKGVLLLVAPLPACVNPLLYLLFNPLAREELAALAKRTCGARQRRGGGGRSAPVAMESTYDEDAEKQSCDSTQALVELGGVKEEEEERGRMKSETQHSVAFVVPRH
ncbi:hypothetical protein F2P81_017859 [Scophthalmus maximus]|uniref:G-protein coupled receptors family 1 profile domain-containing protein n=1 Tax=Scophthalmus maximus TaxID=52904 RepID=A0A6A4SD13_SCOMX|nr:hypothetical protein F2P81_017859 [Scophthalmus maximus]